MKRLSHCFPHAALAVILALVASSASANLVTNGDFETGNLAGWTTFTTGNGTIGSPIVTLANVTGSGASNAAQLDVGQVNFTYGVQQGGGMWQSIATGTGMLHLSAAIAALSTGIWTNVEAGVFSLILDGIAVDTHAFGQIGPGSNLRSSLAADTVVTAGVHSLGIEVTRPFMPAGYVLQYFDNIVAEQAAVPEPATLALLGLGLAGLGFSRRKQI